MRASGKINKIIKLLGREYPVAECELVFHNPFEVLIATVLSAQCTDKKVNTVTPQLFKRYPDATKLAAARVSSVENIIKSLGLYRSKAKNIINAAKSMVQDFSGEVPGTLDELVTLAGVGRKTANCVLVNAFDKPGIMVDTHCIRLSNRLGLVDCTDAKKIELELKGLVPEAQQGAFSHRIILHGRRVCVARKPKCAECVLSGLCPSCEVSYE